MHNYRDDGAPSIVDPLLDKTSCCCKGAAHRGTEEMIGPCLIHPRGISLVAP